MDHKTKQIAAPGMASMLLLAEYFAWLANSRQLSIEETREIIDRALLAAEQHLAADPEFGAAVRKCLEAFLADHSPSAPRRGTS